MPKKWGFLLFGIVLTFIGMIVFYDSNSEINESRTSSNQKTELPKKNQIIEEKIATKTSEDLKNENSKETNTPKQKNDIESSKKDIEKNITNLPTQSRKISFQVIVKNEDGALIENAHLELTEGETKINNFSFNTDKEGKAELIYSATSVYSNFNLKVTHKNYAPKIYPYFNKQHYTPNKPLLIIMVKGSTIKGIVRDTSGKLLEGVEIHLQKNVDDIYSEVINHVEIGLTKSKENGVFEFLNVAPGKISFYGSSVGYILIKSNTFKAPRNEEIILVFQNARDFTIKVINQEGIGIAKASVNAFLGELGLQPFIKETDGNGICQFVLPKEKIVRLTISHPDYVTYDSNYRYGLQETEPTSVTLIKGNKLKGKIIDKETKAPLKYVYIYCYDNTGDNSSEATYENGVYQIPSLKEGQYALTIQCDTHKGIESFSVTINNEKDTIQDFELESGKRLTFKLIDGKSKALLSNKTVQYGWHNEIITTDEKGEFSILTEYDQSTINLYLKVDSYIRFSQTVNITGDITPIEISPEAILHVFIAEQADSPLDEFNLRCTYDLSFEKREGELQITYDSNNKCFDVFGLTEGKVNLIFEGATFGQTKATTEISLTTENKLNLDLYSLYLLSFRLNSSDNKINLSEMKGKIVYQSSNSKLNFGARVLDYNEESKCFESYAALQNADSFVICFPNHLPTSSTIIQKPPSHHLEYTFILNKGLGFEGEIVDVKGKPIIDATLSISNISTELKNEEDSVIVKYANDSASSLTSHDFQCENGKFTAYGFVAGKYAISIYHKNYLIHNAFLELTNQNKTGLQFALKEGLLISGTVSDSNGKLIANGKITLTVNFNKDESIKNNSSLAINSSDTKEAVPVENNANISNCFYAEINNKGEFFFKNIQAGNYLLDVESNLGLLDKYPLTVYEGQNITALSINLEESLQISGIVLDEKEKPLKNIWVNANNDKNSVSTNEEGVFKILNVTNKKYLLTVTSGDGYKLDIAIEVNGGDDNVKIIMKEVKRTLIKGLIYTPDGKECTNYRLSYLYIPNPKTNENQSDLRPTTVSSNDAENELQHLERGNFVNTNITNSGFQCLLELENSQLIKIIATSPDYGRGESELFNLQQYAGQQILVTFKPRIFINLRIIDLYTRQPISRAAAKFILEDIYTENYSSSGLNLSDEKGIITLVSSTLGKGAITVLAAGYAETKTEINIAEKNPTIEIALSKGGSIKGQMLDFKNTPMAFTALYVQPIIETSPNKNNIQIELSKLRSTSDENGFYEIKYIPAGQYFLRTDVASPLQAKIFFLGIPITVEEGKEINLTREKFLSLTKITNVNITLKGADIAKKQITIKKIMLNEKTRAPAMSSVSNLLGKVNFSNIPLGRYMITVDGFVKPISVSLEVVDEKEINLEIPVE